MTRLLVDCASARHCFQVQRRTRQQEHIGLKKKDKFVKFFLSESMNGIHFKRRFYLFIFGCVGSSLLHRLLFSSCREWGPLSLQGAGFSWRQLLLLQSKACRTHRLQYVGCVGTVVAAPRLWGTGAVFVAHGLICSTACGIFPDQGLNPHLPHQQADSLPLSHKGNPRNTFLYYDIS